MLRLDAVAVFAVGMAPEVAARFVRGAVLDWAGCSSRWKRSDGLHT